MAETPKLDGEVASSNAWSDADYIRSLKRLHELQSQIDNLRAALPSIIAPLTSPPTPATLSTISPSLVYTEFATQAVQAMRDVKTLREQWESEETKKILDYTQESLDKEADVEWEFVKSGRWGEIPEEETSKDGEVTEQPGQDAENKTEAVAGASG